MTKAPMIALRFRAPDLACYACRDQKPPARKDVYNTHALMPSIIYDRSAYTKMIDERLQASTRVDITYEPKKPLELALRAEAPFDLVAPLCAIIVLE
jgi:hypothetical protein